MQKLTKSGQFKIGLAIAAVIYTHFTMREADVGDMIEAETDAGSTNPIAFNTALISRQLVSVATADGKVYEGPFISEMLRSLKMPDYKRLRDVQEALEKLGESEQAA